MTQENPDATKPDASSSPKVEVVELHLRDPLCWLYKGLMDFRRQPMIGLFYGLMFWGMAMVVRAFFLNSPEYTLSAVSGCLLLGPFLAMGLYDASMKLSRGEAPTLSASMRCWQPHTRSMGMLVMLLVVLELLWGRASLVVFAVFFNTGMPSTANVVDVLFNAHNWDFIIAYTCVGGFFACLVFASTVVSIPMILDRDTDAITACLTSMTVFVTQTWIIGLWGLIITVMLLISFLPLNLGLIITGPWLGFASWHAYQRCVKISEN